MPKVVGHHVLEVFVDKSGLIKGLKYARCSANSVLRKPPRVVAKAGHWVSLLPPVVSDDSSQLLVYAALFT